MTVWARILAPSHRKIVLAHPNFSWETSYLKLKKYPGVIGLPNASRFGFPCCDFGRYQLTNQLTNWHVDFFQSVTLSENRPRPGLLFSCRPTIFSAKRNYWKLFRFIPKCQLEIIYQTSYRMGNLFRFSPNRYKLQTNNGECIFDKDTHVDQQASCWPHKWL